MAPPMDPPLLLGSISIRKIILSYCFFVCDLLSDKNGSLYDNMSCHELNSFTDVVITYLMLDVIFTTGNIKRVYGAIR